MEAPGVEWMSPGAEGRLRTGRMRTGIVKRERERIVPDIVKLLIVFYSGGLGVVDWIVRT